MLQGDRVFHLTDHQLPTTPTVSETVSLTHECVGRLNQTEPCPTRPHCRCSQARRSLGTRPLQHLSFIQQHDASILDDDRVFPVDVLLVDCRHRSLQHLARHQSNGFALLRTQERIRAETERLGRPKPIGQRPHLGNRIIRAINLIEQKRSCSTFQIQPCETWLIVCFCFTSEDELLHTVRFVGNEHVRFKKHIRQHSRLQSKMQKTYATFIGCTINRRYEIRSHIQH